VSFLGISIGSATDLLTKHPDMLCHAPLRADFMWLKTAF
jgi:hypothetical protein